MSKGSRVTVLKKYELHSRLLKNCLLSRILLHQWAYCSAPTTLEGPMELLFSEGTKDFCHSLLRFFDVFKTIAVEGFFPKVTESKAWTVGWWAKNSFGPDFCQVISYQDRMVMRWNDDV